LDRLVCTIQSNQTLDALIKYHILYSGQLETRLSVFTVLNCCKFQFYKTSMVDISHMVLVKCHHVYVESLLNC